MQYDKSGVSRRLLLRGGAAACLGTAGFWALANGLPVPGNDPDVPARGGSPGGTAASGGAGTAGSPPAGAANPAGGARPDSAPAAAAPTGVGRTMAYRTRPYTGAPGRTGRSPALRPPTAVWREARLRLTAPGKRIALTFDDGPHPVHTPAMLKILRRNGVRATFFILGEWGQEFPDLVRRMAREGHEVANHTWSHPELDRISTARVRDELGRTCELIHRCTGTPPALARGPYGLWDGPSLRVCAELGMEPVGWSIDTSDWRRPGVAAIRSRVLTDAGPGAIVLSHDGGGNRRQSVRALASYLPRLLERGYTVTPVGTAG